jgi:glc operon protein GlcG
MNIAVVDDGGHLLVFSRMDGAKLSSIRIAMNKAHAAAIRRKPSGPALGSDGQPNVLLSVSLAIGSGAQQTPIRGGLPLIVDGEVVGAVGVSNGSEDEDVDVARAGAAALEKA